MSLNAGTKLRFFSLVELEEIFLHAEERNVNKYGVISFEGNTYEAPAELIGKNVIVRYSLLGGGTPPAPATFPCSPQEVSCIS